MSSEALLALLESLALPIAHGRPPRRFPSRKLDTITQRSGVCSSRSCRTCLSCSLIGISLRSDRDEPLGRTPNSLFRQDRRVLVSKANCRGYRVWRAEADLDYKSLLRGYLPCIVSKSDKPYYLARFNPSEQPRGKTGEARFFAFDPRFCNRLQGSFVRRWILAWHAAQRVTRFCSASSPE